MTSDKKIINSGEDFTVTFKNGKSDVNGLFTVFYECDPNVTLLAVENNGLKNIDCNKAYYLLNNTNSLKIRAQVKNESLVRLVLTGSLENNETLKSETVGVVRLTIKNDAANTVVNTPTNNTNTQATSTTVVVNKPIITNPVYVTPNYYGRPDLAVRVLQVGTLNTANNLITSKTTFNYGEMVGVKFEVRNDGDANTGIWNFTAALPSITNPSYTGPTQFSLRPGESIQFTLGFTNSSNQYNGSIVIKADPSNIVAESNENNNSTVTTIINNGYNNNYNYNYNNNNSIYPNSCYVNGVLSYNCLGYNNNNYYNNYLTVSCYANPSNPRTGETVRWYANAYGGNGNYDYDWTGTNSLNSSSQNPSKSYSSSGTKTATVTVTDGNGYTATQSCSVYVGGSNNNNSDVNLAVEILAVGRMSSSGNFIEDDTINEGDDAAVKFRVTNEGDESSGRWDYEVDLTPSFSGDTYRRTSMSSLSAGESITVTVQFNDVDRTGTNRFRVEVDPDDDIGDDDRDNNDDSETIYVD